MRGTADNAAAPMARWRNVRRGHFMMLLHVCAAPCVAEALIVTAIDARGKPLGASGITPARPCAAPCHAYKPLRERSMDHERRQPRLHHRRRQHHPSSTKDIRRLLLQREAGTSRLLR